MDAGLSLEPIEHCIRALYSTRLSWAGSSRRALQSPAGGLVVELAKKAIDQSGDVGEQSPICRMRSRRYMPWEVAFEDGMEPVAAAGNIPVRQRPRHRDCRAHIY
jgi:hypothetical protein